MPINVELKKKAPKFDGDRPRWNLVASGPVELFNTGMERFMFLHGMNGINEEGDYSIWSSMPSIGAPPVYLADILRKKYGCKLKPDTARLIEQAVKGRGDGDNLDHFIGRPNKRTGGGVDLVVAAGSVDFIANCSEDHWERRNLLEGAGWTPIEQPTPAIAERFGTRPYRTRDPFLAGNLEMYMPAAVKQKMQKALGAASRNIALSKTQKAPDDFAVPAPEGIDYFDFQKGGIQMVVDSGKGAIIADDMGLGKTIQGIGVLNGRPDAKRAIFFCQANMKLKWVREIEKWKINRDLTVGYAEGSTFPDTDVVVINYDIAQKNIDKIRAIDWDLVITDEAHNLKNPEAQRTQAILGDLDSFEGLGPIPMNKNGQLVHLTGTPKPNRVAELWPLLTSSRPDIWGRGPEARQAFLNRYEPPILIQREVQSKFEGGKPRKIIVPMPGKPIRELELQMRMRGSGSFIRRLKRDTDLPPKMRTPIEMPFRLSKEDLEILKQAEADLDEIHDRIRGKKLTAGQTRQAREVIDVIGGMNPGSPHFSEIARVRKNLGVLKAPHAARFIIDELHDDKDLPADLRRKTVVFAHHKEVIRKIAEMAEAEFPGGVLVYDGSSKGNAQQAQAKVDAFQENPKSRLFIMSLSGATGITLTAAHRMRVVEPDWSPSNMTQIEDRIWRIGQEQACDIGYLFVPNSLDVKMGLALHAKMETDERAVNTMSYRGMKTTRRASSEIVTGDAGASGVRVNKTRTRSGKNANGDETQPELPL